jgi:hypothetical protein
MLRLPRAARIFVATRAAHPSAGADSLVRRVREEFGEDAFSGNLFCFFSRRRTKVKLLVWDQNGFWIFSKRLERGRFEQVDSRTPWLEISRAQLVMLLMGIDTQNSRFRPGFARTIRLVPRGDGADRGVRATR